MGMFSWKCKGCGEELKMGEIVRMAGVTGEYDGYGRAGNFDSNGEDYPCWHKACYDKATPEEKLDDTPSDYADNQGFGYPRYEFLKPYKPDHYVLRADALIDTSVEDRDDEDRSPEWISFKNEFPKAHREHCYKNGKFNPMFMGSRGFEYHKVLTLGEAEKIAEYHLDDFAKIDIIAMGEGHGIIRTFTNEDKMVEMKAYEKRSNEAIQKYMNKKFAREKN